MGLSLRMKSKSCLKNSMLRFGWVTTKYKHTQKVFVESFNKELTKLLFKPMDAEEPHDLEKVSRIWVKYLYKIVNKMNNTISLTIGMRPMDAIKLDIVPLDKIYSRETKIPDNGLYRYFYQPSEQHGEQKKQAKDLIWSKNAYPLDRIVQDSGNRVLYHLQDGPDKAFVRKGIDGCF